jgi:hypothetical protein
MRTRAIVLLFVFATVMSAARAAHAQSLADLARQEGERRKGVQGKTKTLTNLDLPNAPGTSQTPASTSTSDADGDKSKATSNADAGKSTDKAKDAEKPRDQKYWADRQKALQDKLAQDQVLADAMQARISALTTDFVNRDDPSQRAVIARNRQAALDELARLKQATVDDTQALSDMQEEARKAGVPPGWLR